jgi:hypothetical protein
MLFLFNIYHHAQWFVDPTFQQIDSITCQWIGRVGNMKTLSLYIYVSQPTYHNPIYLEFWHISLPKYRCLAYIQRYG